MKAEYIEKDFAVVHFETKSEKKRFYQKINARRELAQHIVDNYVHILEKLYNREKKCAQQKFEHQVKQFNATHNWFERLLFAPSKSMLGELVIEAKVNIACDLNKAFQIAQYIVNTPDVFEEFITPIPMQAYNGVNNFISIVDALRIDEE